MPDVLLMAYGTPYTEDDIEPYYTDIRRGKPPPPELLEELVQRYRTIGFSPLNDITFAQARGLQEALGGTSRIWVGMKHWTPWIREAVAEMAEAGVEQAVGIVAAPHYSRFSIGGYIDRVEKALEELGHPFTVRYVQHYYDHPLYIQAVTRRVRATLARFTPGDPAFVLFTAHSLPQRILGTGDPYPEQIQETARLVAQTLGLEVWGTAYQSAGRTPEPWLGPDILQKLDELAEKGVTRVAVAAVGFPTDHLEVLYDIDYEAQNRARQRGMELERVPSLNADGDYLEALKVLIEDTVAGQA